MSEYSDLPDNIRRAIKELFDTLSGMTASQIFDLLDDIFGEDMVTILTDILESGEEFEFILDEPSFLNLEQFVEGFDEYKYYNYSDEVEPYYEISYNSGHSAGEIIVEMPGLDDLALIDWYEYDDEIFIYSMNGIEQYKLVIPLPDYFHIEENAIVYRHGLLIMPFQIV